MAFPDGYVIAEIASKKLGRHRSRITRYVQDGHLKGTKKWGRLWITIKSIENFTEPPRGNPMLLGKKRRKKKA